MMTSRDAAHMARRSLPPAIVRGDDIYDGHCSALGHSRPTYRAKRRIYEHIYDYNTTAEGRSLASRHAALTPTISFKSRSHDIYMPHYRSLHAITPQ